MGGQRRDGVVKVRLRRRVQGSSICLAIRSSVFGGDGRSFGDAIDELWGGVSGYDRRGLEGKGGKGKPVRQQGTAGRRDVKGCCRGSSGAWEAWMDDNGDGEGTELSRRSGKPGALSRVRKTTGGDFVFGSRE